MLIFVDFLSISFWPNTVLQKNFLGNMALLIRSNHGKMNTMAISWQVLSQDCSKILPRTCQDLTKISMEGQPGQVILEKNKGKLIREFNSSVMFSLFSSFPLKNFFFETRPLLRPKTISQYMQKIAKKFKNHSIDNHFLF